MRIGAIATGGTVASLAVAAAAFGVATAAAPLAASAASTATRAASKGPVDVLYAASLEDLMNSKVGPAFTAATGYSFAGFPAGSTALEAQIKGKVRQGDVFISASPKADTGLEEGANGSWVNWYSTFANTSLVLGYNPGSRFASQLRTKPWYQVIAEPGFRLGFTDPALDPKGVLAVEALTAAAAAQHSPALAAIAKDRSDLFPEEDLVGRLQAGQLDAGFFYTVEANSARIPTVPLTGTALHAAYTITLLNRAPHTVGGEAFINFLLGPTGENLLGSVGLSLVLPPQVSGTGVPAVLAAVLPRA